VGETTQFLIVLVFEGLYKAAPIVGETVQASVSPDDCVELEVQAEIPNFVRPGIYPVAVVGVVNGASCIVRWMIEVRLSATL
jgi:hypothetical protein